MRFTATLAASKRPIATPGNTRVQSNIIRDNSLYGVDDGAGVIVVGNTVYGHTSVNAVGIFGTTDALDNIVYGNRDGIVVAKSFFGTVSVSGNQVYDQISRGIAATYDVRVSNNRVYSNSIGISANLLSQSIALRLPALRPK